MLINIFEYKCAGKSRSCITSRVLWRVLCSTSGAVSLAVQSPADSVVIILNPENLADQWPMNNSTMAEKMAMSPPSFPNEESHIMRLGLRTF